ncbi:MAG: hypothetical protein BM560_06310 [Roseobacter sp. MedPE-SWde]|nr:MAG: hypothetical protein BM560_06310 [Roseobacter sp. MedPE-SWde]
MRDWDDAFNNMGHVKGSDALPGFWAARVAAYRKGSARIDSDLSYGESEREVFDLIWPETPPAPLGYL